MSGEGMKTHPWMADGEQSSPSLGAIAAYIVSAWKGGQILDAGCGNGDLLVMLKLSFLHDDLCGCDIEPGHVEIARKRTGLAVEVADITRDDRFYGLSFSIIACIGWLHNCWPAVHATGIEAEPEYDYLERFAKRLQSLLDPGGLLIYDWPNESRVERRRFVEALGGAFEAVGEIPSDPVAYVVRRV